MSKFVRIIGFCFDYHCGFSIGKKYEVLTSVNGEEYAIDDEGRQNFAIYNCVRTISV